MPRGICGVIEDVAAAASDPLAHYVEYGAAEGRWPNRYFDPAWYRQENPDVAAAGIDPLLHYMTNGEREGRRAHPLFNPGWYRQVYGVPETQLALGHFIGACRTGRVVPSPDLFPVPLMAPYRDDPPAGIDPIGHYLDDLARRAGRKRRCRTWPSCGTAVCWTRTTT